MTPLARVVAVDQQMLSSDPDAVERVLDRWVAEAEQRAARFTKAREEISAVVVTEEGAGGAVKVTVRSDGALVDLVFSDRVRSIRANELARVVLACVQGAQARIAEQVRAILAETVPDEGELAERIAAGYQREAR